MAPHRTTPVLLRLVVGLALVLAGLVVTGPPSPALRGEPPTDLSRPVITGTPEVGETLTARATSSTSGATITYHWHRVPSGRMDYPVADGPQYVVRPEDVGNRLAVRAEATAPGHGLSSSFSERTVVVTEPATSIPAFDVTVTGGARVGDVQVARTSLDDDDSVTLAFQWQRPGGRDGAVDLDDPGARSRELRTPYLPGLSVWVQVTATRGASRTVVRSPARDVLQGRHDATGLRVVGPRRPGRALRAVLTDPDPAVGRRTTWTWVLGGRLRLEGRTITVPRRMAGRTVYVVARLTAPGYADQRLRSRTVRLRGR